MADEFISDAAQDDVVSKPVDVDVDPLLKRVQGRMVESRSGRGEYYRYGLDEVYKAALWVLANKNRARAPRDAPSALAWNLLEFMRTDAAIEKALWMKILDLAARGRDQVIAGQAADDQAVLGHVEELLKRVGVTYSEDWRGEHDF